MSWSTSAALVVPAWIDEKRLIAQDVTPWTELPLWIPESDPEMPGFMQVACTRALAQGLKFRPLEHTLVDTADWLAARDNAGAWREVLSVAKERALLASA